MEAMLVTEQGGCCEEILAPPPPSTTAPSPPPPPPASSKRCRSKAGSANIDKNNTQYTSAGIAAPTPVLIMVEGSATQVKKTRKVKPLLTHAELNGGDVSKKDATSTKPKKSNGKANVSVEGLASGGGDGGAGVAEAYQTRKRMKRPVNPVKIHEHPDMFLIDKRTHTYARVRFSRGQPVVDIRRYTPDVKRAQFYYTANGSMVMSHSEFTSLVENGPKIGELLEQYGGGGGGGGGHGGDRSGGGGVDVEGCDKAATTSNTTSEVDDGTLWL
jgi:hypothetical protein